MNKKEFLKKLEVELKITKSSEHTIKNYTKLNSNFFDFIKKNPGEISEDDVKLYVAENFSERAAISTIMFLAAIKYSFTSILKKDPTAAIKRPKREKRIPTVLTKQEVINLFKNLNNKKSKLMITLMYAAGMRVSELTRMKVEDLDFEEKVGYIRQGKGRKDRIFNIPNFLAVKLKKHVEKQRSPLSYSQTFFCNSPFRK